jgi:phosphoglycerate dehydrogenase-like enzyme
MHEGLMMAGRFRVVIADFLDESSIEADVLGEIADIVLARAHSEDELAGWVGDADALILFHDLEMLGAATFERAGRCRVLVRAGVGFNNVDREAAGRRGVVVCNVPDYGTEEVADHALMLLLAVARRLLICDRSLRHGEWDYQNAIPAPRLRGRTLGLVGCGRIGSAMALRAKPIGLDVAFFDPYVVPGHEKALGVRRADSLEALLEQSHIVSVHCYLGPETHHLIDARGLERMPAGGILVNTARGPIVDQDALVAALETDRLAGAGIDVFEREPLDDDRLRRHPNVVLTPHCAFYSVEGFLELRRKAAEEVRRVLLGHPPLNPVNREFLAPSA